MATGKYTIDSKTSPTLLEYIRLCESNCMDEADARRGYYQLIECAQKLIETQEVSATIRKQAANDIIRWQSYIEEELKHTEGLRIVVEAYTGLVAEKD